MKIFWNREYIFDIFFNRTDLFFNVFLLKEKLLLIWILPHCNRTKI